MNVTKYRTKTLFKVINRLIKPPEFFPKLSVSVKPAIGNLAEMLELAFKCLVLFVNQYKNAQYLVATGCHFSFLPTYFFCPVNHFVTWLLKM